MAIIPLVNLKGGVAKTTNAVAITETFASMGKNVLLIDADHQCTASELLLGKSRLSLCESRKKTLHDLLMAMLNEKFSSEQLIAFVQKQASNIKDGFSNLSVLPCSIRIDDFFTNAQKARKGYQTTREFNNAFARRRSVLRNWLNQNFDYVVVDCPPSISIQVKVLLMIADGYIIPSIPDTLAIRGCHQLIDRIGRTGIKTRGLGILWSLYRQQDGIHREIVKDAHNPIASYASLPAPFKTIIPNTAKIAQAYQEFKEFASLSAKYTPAGSRMYRRLCNEIEKRLVE